MTLLVGKFLEWSTYSVHKMACLSTRLNYFTQVSENWSWSQQQKYPEKFSEFLSGF
jgi:hypothetical protein